jgi:hypothetical protein
MSCLILPRRFYSQPQGAAEIADSYKTGLFAAYVPGAVEANPYNGQLPIHSSDLSFVTAELGLATKSNNNLNHYVTLPGLISGISTQSGLAVLAVIRRHQSGDLSSDHPIASQWGNLGASPSGWLLWLDDINGAGSEIDTIVFAWATGSQPSVDGRIAAPTGSANGNNVKVILALVLANRYAAIFVNGRLLVFRSTNIAAPANPDLSCRLHSNVATVINASALEMYGFAAWNDPTTINTLFHNGASITTNPWQIFKAK